MEPQEATSLERIQIHLSHLGVTAGTYTKVTVDAKGRTIAGTTLATSDLPTLPVATNTVIGGLEATTGFITLNSSGAITNIAATTATSTTAFNDSRNC